MDVAALDQIRIVLDPAGQVGVAIALMLEMFSVALGLSGRGFRLLGEEPGLFFGGVATQILGLPLLTFLIISVIELPASILFWSQLYEATSVLLQTINVSPAIFLVQTTALLIVPLVLGMLVAGKEVIRNDVVTDERPGRVVRFS